MPLAKNYKLCMRAGHSAAVYSSRISHHFNTILSRMLSPATIPYPGHFKGGLSGGGDYHIAAEITHMTAARR